jgi:hypothetical protein
VIRVPRRELVVAVDAVAVDAWAVENVTRGAEKRRVSPSADVRVWTRTRVLAATVLATTLLVVNCPFVFTIAATGAIILLSSGVLIAEEIKTVLTVRVSP